MPEGVDASEFLEVSNDDEELILVDNDDNQIGFLSKGACHDGEGVLHRAFSIFVFNSSGELLVHLRSGEKRLWPGFWSNSCCSHPRRGETMNEAINRRLFEELQMSSELHLLYKFSYHAPFGEAGSEREMCSVFVGRSDDLPRANPHEISDWHWLTPRQLEEEMDARPEEFTPWFKLEWPRVREVYRQRLFESKG